MEEDTSKLDNNGKKSPVTKARRRKKKIHKNHKKEVKLLISRNTYNARRRISGKTFLQKITYGIGRMMSSTSWLYREF